MNVKHNDALGMNAQVDNAPGQGENTPTATGPVNATTDRGTPTENSGRIDHRLRRFSLRTAKTPQRAEKLQIELAAHAPMIAQAFNSVVDDSLKLTSTEEILTMAALGDFYISPAGIAYIYPLPGSRNGALITALPAADTTKAVNDAFKLHDYRKIRTDARSENLPALMEQGFRYIGVSAGEGLFGGEWRNIILLERPHPELVDSAAEIVEDVQFRRNGLQPRGIWQRLALAVAELFSSKDRAGDAGGN